MIEKKNIVVIYIQITAARAALEKVGHYTGGTFKNLY